MLNERRARTASYDDKTRTATLEVLGGSGKQAGVDDVDASVLLDSKGCLVGVDLEPDSSRRVVVMVGAHEAVTTTRSARVSVTRVQSGDVASVVVRDVGRPS
jgi:hypothetical protein